MRDAFGFDVGRFVFYGGYPGAVRFVEDWERWRSYVLDSLVETTVSRDVLLLNPVTKPALLRQLFSLACSHSGEIPAYNKMLGQLHDVGNATTLVHYLQLLSGAGIVSAIPKFSGSDVRRKASIPKLIVHNTGLVSAVKGMQLERARSDADRWGRLVETAVGSHLLASGLAVSYWRERNREVDFVVETPETLVAIEVTSGRRKTSLPGFRVFKHRYDRACLLLVGGQGVALDEFLASPVRRWTG